MPPVAELDSSRMPSPLSVGDDVEGFFDKEWSRGNLDQVREDSQMQVCSNESGTRSHLPAQKVRPPQNSASPPLQPPPPPLPEVESELAEAPSRLAEGDEVEALFFGEWHRGTIGAHREGGQVLILWKEERTCSILPNQDVRRVPPPLPAGA